MIPNVRGSVTDYANEKCVYAGRCLGPINRPLAVAGLRLLDRNVFFMAKNDCFLCGNIIRN